MSCTIIQWFLCMMLTVFVQATPYNISCYQCIKHVDEECSTEYLKPCPTYSDRCVKHISKTADKGFTIKRECGLGPCGFDDDMTNRGLGMDTCNRSNDEYFCVFCCQGNGCNQNGAVRRKPSMIIIIVITIMLLNIFNRFQPPYVLDTSDNI